MKITHNKVGQNLNLTDSSRADKASKNSGVQSPATDSSNIKANSVAPSNTDSVKVDLSERSQDIQRAKEIAKSGSDVDLAKIEKFQKLIDEGKYKIDSKAIADRMVDEHLMSAGRTNNE